MLTADEVRDELRRCGWETLTDNASTSVFGHGSIRVVLWKMHPWLEVLNGERKYVGPVPATLSDLRALLRCLGAPVSDDVRIQAAICEACLAGHPVVQTVVATERRHEDRPERIPCKLVATASVDYDGDYMSCRGCDGGCCWTADEWRTLMGRRDADRRRA